jgi:hypothetical protein
VTTKNSSLSPLRPESRGGGRSGHTYGPGGHVRMSKCMVWKIIMKMHS